eukprot:SAG11_NODE_2720_length_3046_cov_40.638955_1_plen_49_part_00
MLVRNRGTAMARAQMGPRDYLFSQRMNKRSSATQEPGYRRICRYSSIY